MKRIKKNFAILTVFVALFAMLTVTAYADSPDSSDDISLVFIPETQLTVYVDGSWDSTRSDTYAFGDYVLLTAPEVSGKSFTHWEADGSIVSYNNPLELTMNAHTTLYAVYANAASTAKPVAGFTSITRTDDGERISFQAIASGDRAGIVYSTTATGNDLKIGGTGVTNVAAEKITDSTTTMPKSVLDNNNCWMLQITPDNANTVYHARAYVTNGSETTYGDVKDVKLSDLNSGVSLVTNLEGFDPEELTERKLTITYDANGGIGATMTQVFLNGQSVKLRANTFTREGYTFNGWSTNQNGGGSTYTDGQSVTLSDNITLYAQWEIPQSEDEQAVVEVTEGINDFPVPESNAVTKPDKETIEETDDEKAPSPQTGEDSHMGLWIALMLLFLCVCGIAAVFLFGRKKKEKSK